MPRRFQVYSVMSRRVLRFVNKYGLHRDALGSRFQPADPRRPHSQPITQLSPEIATIPTDTAAAIPSEAAASAETANVEPNESATRDAKERRSGVLTSKEQARIAIEAAVDRKALDLKAMDLSGISDFTDIFVICSGTNERQVKAIADYIVHQLRDQKIKPLHIEGLPRARWVLLDYGGDMVIHVFHQETRSFYALERLWSDAPDLTGELTAGLILEGDT